MGKREDQIKKAKEMAEAISNLGKETYLYLFSYRSIHNELSARPSLVDEDDQFWFFTWRSYLNSAILGAASLLENRSDSVNVGNFLDKCRQASKYLPNPEVLELKRNEHDAEVKQLRAKFQDWQTIRHKTIAHRQFRWNENVLILLSEGRDLLKEIRRISNYWRDALGLGREASWLPAGPDLMVHGMIRNLEIAADRREAWRQNSDPIPEEQIPWANRDKLTSPPPNIELADELWEDFDESFFQLRARTKSWFQQPVPEKRSVTM